MATGVARSAVACQDLFCLIYLSERNIMLHMNELLAGLGRAIRTLRERQGLSIGDLAARAELSSRFVTEIQAGRGNVSIVRLAALARALGTTASRLVAEAERDGSQPRLVALLGGRGAGKSTRGAKLAARLGADFLEPHPLLG